MAGSPLLIALPSGLIVSGVAAWAARLCSALAASGRAAGLILHAPPDGHARLEFALHPGVRVFDASGLARFEDVSAMAADDPRVGAVREAWIGAYLEAARSLAGDGGGPVVLSPNLHADCYGVAVEAARREAGLVRLIGWQHNDIEYDRCVLAHYEAALSGLVGVSDRIVAALGAKMAGRRVDSVPYGVEVGDAPPVREALAGAVSGPVGARPVRLLYAGRLEHHQKRVLALGYLSRCLAQRGIGHELTVLGDGPARAELAALVEGMGERPGAVAGGAATVAARSIRLVGAATPGRVRAALREHDAFVLASRFEGLSVAMLEALSAGCVPIVTRVASGALQAIEDGANGFIAEASAEDGEEVVGAALADAVERFLAGDHGALARRAWSTARERFSIEAHARAAARVIDEAGSRAPAAGCVDWAGDRPVWFTDVGAGVPADAARRMGEVIGRLDGRAFVVHGTGAHTRALLGVLSDGAGGLVGFTDDDRQRRGGALGGLPIVGPEDAATLGATDVVISTWMHENGVWARRGVYESQGLRVHRLYGDRGGG
ncbi:MAG: glycosyltransferase [Phycisphaerales bacterium]|nr:glycosyltransferase [Phycisphaerales bacterium]